MLNGKHLTSCGGALKGTSAVKFNRITNRKTDLKDCTSECHKVGLENCKEFELKMIQGKTTCIIYSGWC